MTRWHFEAVIEIFGNAASARLVFARKTGELVPSNLNHHNLPTNFFES
jgi:hypothetical protein